MTTIKKALTVPTILEPSPLTLIIKSDNPKHGNLYLGGFAAAKDIDLLLNNNIRAVLTASVETELEYGQDGVLFHLKLNMHDNP